MKILSNKIHTDFLNQCGSCGEKSPVKSGAYDPQTENEALWVIRNNGFITKSRAEKIWPKANLEDVYLRVAGHSTPLCELCSKPLVFVSLSRGYKSYNHNTCSIECGKSHQSSQIAKKKSGQKSALTKKANGVALFGNAWTNESRKKRKATNIIRTGHPTGYSESSEKKRKDTLLSKYGVTSSFTTEQGLKSTIAQKIKEKESSLKRMIKLNGNFESVGWDGHIAQSTWRCIRCKGIKTYEQTNPSCAIRCNKCDPVVGSLIQLKLKDDLQRRFPDVVVMYNTRKIIAPYELDIFIPSKNVAIEFNGLYWHSFTEKETAVEKNASANKWARCKALGITLITIFEDEAKLNYDIVLSMILAKCGIYEEKIRASTLIIKECKSEAVDFLNMNHIRGYSPSSLSLGLYRGNELMCVAAFGKLRFEKHCGYELIRFASKKNNIIYGGFSKLLKEAKKRLATDSITTYADKCHSIGLTYSKFSPIVHEIPPGYYWWKCNTPSKKNRMHFQKHKLAALLGEQFDKNKSEAENMFSAGWRRIWDCGHLKFII